MFEQMQSGTIKAGDSKAIKRKHGELDALLDLICIDDSAAFCKLTGRKQKRLLRLARSVSCEVGQLLRKSTRARNNPH